MHFQGLNAHIMSLGGIAIAVGAMVDAAIVMIENAHKRLEEWDHRHPGEQIDNVTRWKGELPEPPWKVGPALFISLLINHPVLYTYLYPGRSGRTSVWPAGIHENVLHGGRGRAGHHCHSDPDGILDPGKNSCRDQ
ncbi:efflux RND transporter permease subunit [Enterobacter asburiae]|uniref:efflux RND transporter permease subunit n=1 Tax=Enterobacter asburiae TaxID=61645 RepID=UPI0030F97B19